MPNPYAQLPQWQPGQQLQRQTAPGLPQDPLYTEWAKQGVPGPSAAPRPGYQQSLPGAAANIQNWWQQGHPGMNLPGAVPMSPLPAMAAPLPPPQPVPQAGAPMPPNPYANMGAHPGMMPPPPINFYSRLMQPGY
jgi:hypothetical protein